MASSFEQYVRWLLASEGIIVKKRGASRSREGNVFLEWGGAATVDDSQTLGTFSVIVYQSYVDDASILLGRIWRVLAASDYVTPQTVINQRSDPVADDGYNNVAVIPCNTVVNWWDEDLVAGLPG